MAQPLAYVYYVANAETRHPASYMRLRSDDEAVLGAIDREMVASFPVEIPSENPRKWCEWVFAGMNQGSGYEFPELRNNRSMSVGDAIFFTLNGQPQGVFYCRPIGWLYVARHVPTNVENLCT